MPADNNIIGPAKTSTHKVVLPFYLYAGLSFLTATILLFTSSASLNYFSPQTLAITHAMTLGWGTMVIFGASHQLVPVLIEGALYNNTLAYLCFFFAALGIPLLIYAFYTFNMEWPAKAGALLVNAAIVSFVINITLSILRGKSENVHGIFVLTATFWLLLTAIIGLLLVYNFTTDLLPGGSLHYLSLHAHIGIVGWFLLLVIGVGSRLLPMFLVSKYSNPRLLWQIYILINSGLVAFILLFLYDCQSLLYLLPVASLLAAILLFGYYCYKAFRARLRKRVDEQMKISLFSILLMIVPVLLSAIMIAMLFIFSAGASVMVLYGFTVFFGWITAIILGMTFKTLPFIVWNKVYRAKAGIGKMPNPRDLFSHKLFGSMILNYLLGLTCFIMGVAAGMYTLIKAGTLFLLVTAFIYNANIFIIVFHKNRTG